MTMHFYPIQGALVGIEWDWNHQWFSINLFAFKIIVNYGKESNGVAH